MRKNALLLVMLMFLRAQARQDGFVPHIVPARVGLVELGVAQDGLALAADSSSLNADGRVSQEQRLFQLGKHGALALTGTVSIQDPVGKPVREEVNIARIVGAWAAAHTDVDLQTANRDINATIAAALNKFLATRDPGKERGAFKFGLIVAGFQEGKPALTMTRYFMPAVKGKQARAEETSAVLHAGELWLFSSSVAAADILSDKTAGLKTFADRPAVRKFHSASASSLAAQDFLGLLDAVLRAAESDQGRKIDGKRAIVAPPNRFATVTQQDGFAWSKEMP